LTVQLRVVGGPLDISEFAEVAYIEASSGWTDWCRGGAWGADVPDPALDFLVPKTDRALTLHFGRMGPAVPLDSIVPASVPTPTPRAVAEDRIAAVIPVIEALGGQVSPPDRWTSEELDEGEPFAPPGGGTLASAENWTVVWDTNGVMVRLIQGTSGDSSQPKLTAAQAKARVLQVGDILGVTMTGPDEVTYLEDPAGWVAEWNRRIDGIPTESDGVQIVLGRDGTFGDYEYQWSPVGPKPETVLTKAQALALAGEDCAHSQCEAILIWQGDTASALRLTWEVYPPSMPCAGYWFDAGTGEVLSEPACI
jgi:hypothetical protein